MIEVAALPQGVRRTALHRDLESLERAGRHRDRLVLVHAQRDATNAVGRAARGDPADLAGGDIADLERPRQVDRWIEREAARAPLELRGSQVLREAHLRAGTAREHVLIVLDAHEVPGAVRAHPAITDLPGRTLDTRLRLGDAGEREHEEQRG